MDRFRLMPNYRYYSAEGVSPLSISSPIGKPLRNYRIYGSGGGVGDKSKNLFDVKWIMEQANAGNFFELNDETLILKSYACKTYISPEKFLEYTGLSEGDTIVTSLNITLVAGTTTDNYFGRVMFWSKDTTTQPNLILTVDGSSRQLTIPEGFNSTNYGDMFFYGAKNADENGNLEAHVTEFMITKDLTATEYESYHKYDVPITVRGKNLLPYPYYNTTKTINGVTFTDNGDGSITVNGTATNNITYALYIGLENVLDKTKVYTMSVNIYHTNAYIYINLYKNKEFVKEIGVYSNTNYKTFNLSEYDYTKMHIYYFVKSGEVFDNVVIKPQLEEGETASEYEPYIAPNTYNIYLDEPLAEGEYIDYINGSGLPRIQTNKGTNIITVDTEVKPPNIEVQYYK